MSFKDIKGQDEVIRSLKAAYRSGKMPHAYIFCGPRGCGRSALAANFAKYINCEEPQKAPCDSCVSCGKIDKDIHPDVKWIRKGEKDTEIKIEKIRELEKQIIFKPYEGKYKVYIIEDAELMSIEATNSFLKTLEEPPQNSLLILITEKPKDLPPTIVSRCQPVRLKPQQREETGPILTDVLEEFSRDAYVENYKAGNRDELSARLNILAGWYRDLLVFNSTGDERLLIHRGKADDIKRDAASYGTGELMDIFESILDAKEKVESNVNPKLALSAMRLRCTK